MNPQSGLLIHRITPLCQLQDLGRWGYQQFGVSRSGAMDPYSLRLANILVGNAQDVACLEFALAGAKFEVTAKRIHFAFVGNFPLRINGDPYPSNASYTLTKGERLEIVASNGFDGTHGYLSVLGGFEAEPQLGSCSTHLRSALGGFTEPLRRGVIAPTCLDECDTAVERQMPEEVLHGPSKTIRVVPGPQSGHFSSEQLASFLETEWQVAPNSDRMGYRLQGNTIEIENGTSMISEPVCPGSVQIPSSGQPIILMPDCGTVGGYPKIATVVSVDRGKIAQMRVGAEFKFEAIDAGSAQALLQEQGGKLAIQRESFLGS